MPERKQPIGNDPQSGALPQGSLYWVLFLALTCFVVGLCVMPTSANDLFWQLRTGREILERHQIPHFDTYSWTSRGTPWIVHEWLSFALFWQAYQCGQGFAGVWLLQTVIVVATCLILFDITYRESGQAPLTAFLMTIGATTTASGFFQPRPHLFTYLFLTITVGLALPARRATRLPGYAWALVPMTVLWANLHAGALIGVGLLAAFAAGDAVLAALRDTADPRRGPALISAKHLALIAAACGAATLITPYGWHVYQNFGATIGNSTAMNMVSEWTSPDFHDLFGKVFECMLGVVLFALVGTQLKRDPAEAFIIVALAHAGLTSSRNIPLFAFIAVPLAARHVPSALARMLGGMKQASDDAHSLFGTAPSLLSVVAVAVAFMLIPVLRVEETLSESHNRSPQILDRLASTTIVLDSFPEGACRFLESEKFPASLRLYNTYDIGGFLIWRIPEYPVFIDGRADVYFNKTLGESMDLAKLRFDWESHLDNYGADFAIIPSRDPEAHLFMSSPEWALVYADRNFTAQRRADDTDDNGLVFLKRTAGNARLIAQCRQDCPAARSQQIFESKR